MSLCRTALFVLVLAALPAGPMLAAERGQKAQHAGSAPTADASGSGAVDWQQFVPPTDGSFTTYGDGPPEFGLVKRIFELSFTEACSWALGGSLEGIGDPDEFAITYRADYDEETAPERVAVLYRFFCNAGAYNEQHVYLLWSDDDGLRPVLFPEPRLDIRYVDDNYDGALESIAINGFTAATTLVNSWFDPESLTIYTASHWRGLGDASSQARYVFRGGSFVLDRYDVDPTYDGEVNRFRIYDASSPRPVELVPVPEADMAVNPAYLEEE